MRIRIRIYSVLKNHPNTNTNTIRFENICRIRIRISLFGLNYSNTIRIPNYSLTSAPVNLVIMVIPLIIGILANSCESVDLGESFNSGDCDECEDCCESGDSEKIC